MADRRPWLKWYPADWRAEPTLRMCSRAARSLWLDMLGLMHDGEPYGHLTVSGIIPTPKQLASLLGDTERETLRLLAELEAAGVFSRDDAGRIFCRRMLRDKAREDRDRENGKGGGNPYLKGAVASPVKAEGNPGVNPPDKAHMPEARSQKPEKKDTPPPSGSAPSLAERPSRIGTRLPADWTLSPELRAWAVAEGLADPDREAAKFRDHWTAKTGKDATKLDWNATWRTWVRKAIDWSGGPKHGQAEQARPDGRAERVEAILARVGGGPAPGGGDGAAPDAGAVLPAVPGGR